jgi:hypothetical protein
MFFGMENGTFAGKKFADYFADVRGQGEGPRDHQSGDKPQSRRGLCDRSLRRYQLHDRLAISPGRISCI